MLFLGVKIFLVVELYFISDLMKGEFEFKGFLTFYLTGDSEGRFIAYRFSSDKFSENSLSLYSLKRIK